MKIYKIASEEHDIRKDKFRYCPVCGEFYERQCKCASFVLPHTMEDLKRGHGFSCKNGHRWSGDLVYNPRDEEAEKNLRRERNQTPMAEEIRKNLRIK